MKLERIHTIDIVRGWFIFVIIVNHLERWPSGFELLTGRGSLWVSAAEGFFFMSGVMIGLIRGRKSITQPFLLIAQTLAKRAALLYVWVVGLTLFFTWITTIGLTNGYAQPGLWQGSYGNMLLHTLTLQYVYTWADFLKYYAVYVLAAIPAVWLLRRGYWWIILMSSLVLWGGGGLSEIFNWQLFFFGGAIAGWYWQTILENAKKLPAVIKNAHYPLAILTIVLSFAAAADIVPALSNIDVQYFDRFDMTIWRVLMFGLWFSALYRLVSSREAWMHQKVGWFFETLGKNSLYCYILSSFVVIAVHAYIPKPLGFVSNFIITILAVTTIWFAAYKRILFRVIPR